MAKHPLTPMVIFCNSETWIFFPGMPFVPAEDWEMLRDGLETMNMPASNLMEISIGIQVCNTTDDPDNAVPLASLRTSDGLTFPAAFVDKSATTGNRQLVRGGYLARNASGGGSTMRHAWVAGMIESRRK